MAVDGEPLPEWRRVEKWRRERLEEAGFPGDYADGLAKNHEVDLHRAIELLKSGCDVETAQRILT